MTDLISHIKIQKLSESISDHGFLPFISAIVYCTIKYVPYSKSQYPEVKAVINKNHGEQTRHYFSYTEVVDVILGVLTCIYESKSIK